MPELTRLLNQISAGDPNARGAAFDSIYGALKTIARRQMAAERPGHTLTPTALVNEACLRLLGADATWDNRRHFYGAATEAMRRILIDHARRRSAARRGGDWLAITLDDALPDPNEDPEQLLMVDQHLLALERHDPDLAEIVKLRYYGGFELAEIAHLVGVSERTVMRRWRAARAWIGVQMEPAPTAK